MPNAGDSAGNGGHIPIGPGREFDLIRGMVARWGDLARGIGDDAAALAVPAGEQLIVSSDTALERVHFRSEWLTPAEIGYRSAVAASSDIAAMGARPLGMTVALVLPAAWIPHLHELADGIGAAARATATAIIGGDLTRGDALAITVTVLGASVRPVRRRGASAGNSVFVTGVLGGPGAALRALERGDAPDPLHRSRFATPVARIAEGEWLAAHGATAMIDISDSLASEARHLAAASDVAIDIALDCIPLVRGVTPSEAALGGEEYELLLTAPAELDAAEFGRRFGIPLTRIGSVSAMPSGQRALASFTLAGARVDLAQGYDHFST